MKGNRVKKEKKLRKKYISVLIILAILMITLTCVYNSNKKSNNLNITETATTDYKVYLKDNKFYEEDYVVSDKQYISDIIKNITADYNYGFNLNNKKETEYVYKVDAMVDIYDTNTKKSLYTYTENIVPENNCKSDDGKISINENVEIDYPYFNDIADRFINTYALSVVNASVLKVNLLVKTEYTDESIITLSVPLNKHTVDIETSNQLVSNQTSNVIVDKNSDNIQIVIVLGFITLICLFIFVTRKLILNLLDSRTDEEKYKSNLKKILMNYGDYINKTDDFEFDLNKYEIIRVNTFLDLLKIKEDLSRPILMVENKEKTNVIFALTDNTNFIYIFALNLNQKKLAEKNEQVKTNI